MLEEHKHRCWLHPVFIYHNKHFPQPGEQNTQLILTGGKREAAMMVSLRG